MREFTIALVGAPNCGKSTLFNGLTGGRAKVANYPGATVEMRKGTFSTPKGNKVTLLDLPGFYGMTPRSMDERVALDVLKGTSKNQKQPDVILALLDANNLRNQLHFILQLKTLGKPVLLVLNMFDLAQRNGLEIDPAKLSSALELPVVTAQATRKKGRADTIAKLDEFLAGSQAALPTSANNLSTTRELQIVARAIAKEAILKEPVLNKLTRQLDQVFIHPFLGPMILASILFFLFQAVFSWSETPMLLIEDGILSLGKMVSPLLPAGWIRDLFVDGIIAGVGSVLVFLPQILILFAFILLLEASGYMARAAFLMDELMMRIGLNGRAFIPLLSSFACAIPGIMAARVIESEKDRLTTILIAPLMTCSARLPVYGLLIAAFIPPTAIGPFNLQGLVLFGLYLFGILSAIIVAFILKRTITRGTPQALLMELPSYKMPNLRDFAFGLLERAKAFIKRAGTIVLGTSIFLWILVSYPTNASTLEESFAGQIASFLEKLLAPIGFNLEISIALIPGMAAREVAVGALGTVYAVQNPEQNTQGLVEVLQSAWSLPTALAFIMWYVFAPQCFATMATIKRETNSWAWTGFAFVYLFLLAFCSAGTTYHLSSIWLS